MLSSRPWDTIFFAAINTLEPTPYIFLANVVLLVVYLGTA
jgi:hypothetical protein